MQELQFFIEDSQTTAIQKLKFFFRKVTFHDLTKRATDKAMQSKERTSGPVPTISDGHFHWNPVKICSKA